MESNSEKWSDTDIENNDNFTPVLESQTENPVNTVPEEKVASEDNTKKSAKLDKIEMTSSETGQSFADKFKNILSSVLKTDLGQVLKNRGDKNLGSKTVSETRVTSPLPSKTIDDSFDIDTKNGLEQAPDTEKQSIFKERSSSDEETLGKSKDPEDVKLSFDESCIKDSDKNMLSNFITPILTRASSKSLLFSESFDELKVAKDIDSDSQSTNSGSVSDGKSATAISTDLGLISQEKFLKHNRARKSMTKAFREENVDDAKDAEASASQVPSESPGAALQARGNLTRRRSYKSTPESQLVANKTPKTKKKIKRFKGGTYQLSIKPKRKKKNEKLLTAIRADNPLEGEGGSDQQNYVDDKNDSMEEPCPQLPNDEPIELECTENIADILDDKEICPDAEELGLAAELIPEVVADGSSKVKVKRRTNVGQEQQSECELNDVPCNDIKEESVDLSEEHLNSEDQIETEELLDETSAEITNIAGQSSNPITEETIETFADATFNSQSSARIADDKNTLTIVGEEIVIEDSIHSHTSSPPAFISSSHSMSPPLISSVSGAPSPSTPVACSLPVSSPSISSSIDSSPSSSVVIKNEGAVGFQSTGLESPNVIETTEIKQEIQEQEIEMQEIYPASNEISNTSEETRESNTTSTISKDMNGMSHEESYPQVESMEDASLGRMSVALSVKRRHGLKRKKVDGEDLENDLGIWCLGNEHLLPKRAKKVAVAQPPLPQQINFETPPLQLCTCQENCSTLYAASVKETYCQAVDCIDDRIIGCCNFVTRPLLNRPSRVIPFMALCEVHRSRLRLHHCCPGCGLFCTQGLFVKCNDSSSKAWHLFHERCCLISNGEGLCPHCGQSSEWIRVRLRINGARSPVFCAKQQQISKRASARMTISRGNDPSQSQEDTTKSQLQKMYKIPLTGKEISSGTLPFGPDRVQLESLLINLALEKPMNLRYTIKSMYNAAKSNDVEKILHMLAMGFDPNHKFEEHDNETALHAACSAGHLVIVHVLHQAGAYLDTPDNKLRTPLMLTVENKQTAVIQYFIRSGAHLEARGEDGMTVLHLASKAGNLEACRLLLQTGKININIQDDGGWTPVVWAAEHRHKEIAHFLLNSGSDPNIRDNEHNIALHWAAFSGSLDICEMLLNKGCDLTSVNEHGDTPLHIAARQDNYDCVILFLARNADISVTNRENEMPIKCCPDETSQTWMALSMNAKLKAFAKMRSSRSEIMLHKDISLGKEINPIPCVNGIDNEAFPIDYLYIIENCETNPINVDRSITNLQSCQCEDDCCSINCACSTLSLKCWYMRDGGLAPEFNLLDPPMIFECNRACRCWKNCSNRVIQHGLTSRLQLFRTQGKGWGVRTLRDIPRGTFICEYIGEVISDSEADHREDDSYLFDLDNRDGETYCIDARHYGNISRFINHLCEPNLVPVKVFIDHQDLRFPRIAFFSSRDIKAYEELGFDYGEKFWIIKYKTFTCMCGAEKCKYSADKIQEMLENYMRRQREEIEV